MNPESPARPRTMLNFLLVCLLLAVLLVQFLPVVRSQISWEDETLHASTSLALMHGSPTATVLSDFPGTHSLLGFYGPVGLWMGEAAFKLLGFSRLSWRLYIFAGNALLYLGAFLLFRSFGRGTTFALLVLLGLSFSMEESMRGTTNGRTDVWAVGGMMLAIAIALYASRLNFGGRASAFWALAGAVCGVFLGYTPRIWVLWASFSVVIFLGRCIDSVRRRNLIGGVLLANVAALASLWMLLAPIGSNPLLLLHTVQQGSRNDKINSSPLMGGSWGFGETHSQALFYLLVIIVLGTFAAQRRLRERVSPQARWFTLAVVLNAILQFLLISRALGNTFFWGIPLTICALGAILLSFESPDITASSRALVLVPGTILLIVMLALRVALTTHAYLESRRDHTAQLQTFIAANIPEHAVVYGPWGVYFFPLEQHSISYRYATEQTTPGLASTSLGLLNQSPLAPALCAHPGFVLWPSDGRHGLPMQPNLQADLGDEVAELPQSPPPHSRLVKLIEKFPSANRHEPTGAILYRLKPPPPAVCAALATH